MNNLPKHMARGPRGAGPPEARGPMQLHRLKAGLAYILSEPSPESFQ